MTQLNARDTGLPCVHYLRKTVSLNDLVLAGAAGVLIGTLPAGAFVTQSFVRVDQVFNAVTTNVLTVGTNATVDNIAGSADITEGSLQTQVISTGAGIAVTSDSDVFVKFTQSGTAATTGRATIVVGYVPNR